MIGYERIRLITIVLINNIIFYLITTLKAYDKIKNNLLFIITIIILMTIIFGDYLTKITERKNDHEENDHEKNKIIKK